MTRTKLTKAQHEKLDALHRAPLGDWLMLVTEWRRDEVLRSLEALEFVASRRLNDLPAAMMRVKITDFGRAALKGDTP